jgi:diguanylate cyclase (GGDEF)-like protein
LGGPTISQPSPAQLLWISLSVLVAGLGLSALAISAIDHSVVPAPTAIVVGLIALHIASHAVPGRLHALRGSVESFFLDDVLLVPLLLALSPWQLLASASAATLAGSLLVRRTPAKAIFNWGQYLIAVVAGMAMFQLVAGPISDEIHLRTIAAAVVGALGITVVSRLAVSMMITVATGAPRSIIVRIPLADIVTWLGAAILGASAAVLTLTYAWGFLPALLLVGLVQRAYTAQMKDAAARTQAERLQEATAELRGTQEKRAITSSLVASACDLVGARRVRIMSVDQQLPPGALAAKMPSGQFLVAEGRIGPGHWTAQERETLIALAGVADDAFRAADLIARLQDVTDAQTEGILSIDVDGIVTFANPATGSMLRLEDANSIVGQPIDDVCSLRVRRKPLDLVQMTRDGGVVQDADATLHAAAGNRIEVAYSFNTIGGPVDDLHTPEGAVLVVRDVTERRAFQEALTYRAMHDELTGLPNRRSFLDRLDELLAQSVAGDQHHVVIFVDLDRFKLVNDSFGHLVGDQLLIQMSDRLLRAVPDSNVIARLSGDEFVVLIEDLDDRGRLEQLADTMLDRLRQSYLIDGHSVQVTVSIGIAVTDPGQTRDDVMLAADAAAYAAKSAGRNCIRFATQELVDASRVRLELEAQLRDAIDNGGLSLRFQPIVDTKTQALSGVEALVRWERDGETVPPGEFIPLAEDSGLIVYVGRWVLDEACRVTQRWNQTHPERRPVMVSVNLSALQLVQPGLAQEVAATLEETGLPPWQLSLEITETALLADVDVNLATLQELRDIGVQVCVDDFGTGYSSLAYLRTLPVDVVKLDRAFIAGLGKDPVDTQIVAAVLRLCKALGRRIVAEGVETELQRQTLSRMGCPYMQGFLIARPMRTEAFEAYWASLNGNSPNGDSPPAELPAAVER